MMALDTSFHITVEGSSVRLRITRVAGTERVHGAFRIEITVRAVDSDGASVPLDPEQLVGQSASLELAHESAPRTLHGIIDGVDEIATGYRLVLVPRVAPLADGSDHRIFLDEDPVAIAKEVLDGHGVDVEVRVTRALDKRAQCVQAFESDLAFVSRILAEEGVLWHVEHDSGKDVVVFSDNVSAYKAIAGDETLAFSAGVGAGLVGVESVFAAVLTRASTFDKLTLGDFDFEKPLLDQAASDGDGTLENYEYPGGYTDPGAGAVLSKIRRQEAQGRKITLRGVTTSRRFAPGATFSLTGAPREDMNGRWLVLKVTHAGADSGADAGQHGRRYEASFVAVPAAGPHRPTRSRIPTLGGLQTATVTGPAGSEIHTEKHGRIKARLRWDRLRKKDDTSSTWVRPIQPPTSGGFFLPRTGWEVLLGFSGASGDMPYEVGRLYNAEAPPPEGLPGQKVRTAFGTLTTPGGGTANLLRMDDAAGNEGMLLNASHDYNERTENDKAVSVTANDIHVVGANHTDIVGIVHEVSVDAAQTYTVGGSRDVTTVGRLDISAASESVAVGGSRIFQVGGDYETQAATLSRDVGALKAEVAIQEVNRHVTGVSTVLVGGGWTEIGGLSSSTSVLGASALSVGGPIGVKAQSYSLKASALSENYGSRNVDADAKRVEAFGGPARYSIGGSLTMSGSVVVFKAAGKITIQASGASITITPGSITIDGDFDSSEASIVTGNETNG
jgi:type VI secretion system secreted protein VgrG